MFKAGNTEIGVASEEFFLWTEDKHETDMDFI